jgi:hypothetical protein
VQSSQAQLCQTGQLTNESKCNVCSKNLLDRIRYIALNNCKTQQCHVPTNSQINITSRDSAVLCPSFLFGICALRLKKPGFLPNLQAETQYFREKPGFWDIVLDLVFQLPGAMSSVIVAKIRSHSQKALRTYLKNICVYLRLSASICGFQIALPLQFPIK